MSKSRLLNNSHIAAASNQRALGHGQQANVARRRLHDDHWSGHAPIRTERGSRLEHNLDSSRHQLVAGKLQPPARRLREQRRSKDGQARNLPSHHNGISAEHAIQSDSPRQTPTGRFERSQRRRRPPDAGRGTHRLQNAPQRFTGSSQRHPRRTRYEKRFARAINSSENSFAGPQDGTLLVTWHPVITTHHPGSAVTGYAVYADGKKVTDVDSPTGDHALIDISKLLGLNPKHVTVRTKARDSQSADSLPTAIPNAVLRGGVNKLRQQPHAGGIPMHMRQQMPRPQQGQQVRLRPPTFNSTPPPSLVTAQSVSDNRTRREFERQRNFPHRFRAQASRYTVYR